MTNTPIISSSDPPIDQARVDAMLGRLSGDAEMYELRDYVEQARGGYYY